MTMRPHRVLLRGGAVLAPSRPDATAMLTVDDLVGWVGDEAGADTVVDQADDVVPLDGRLLTPGFVDAHVHLSKTGFALGSVDLGVAGSASGALDMLAGHAEQTADAVLFAHGWDETRWPEGRPFGGDELDRAVGDRVAYVSRVDSHSAVVSSALVRRDATIPGLDGWHGNGIVERDAHHAARGVVDAMRSRSDREAALVRALRQAAAAGITSLHDANAPHIAPYDDLDLVRDLRSHGAVPEVVSYWGALLGGAHAEAPPPGGFAGDLCVDGAIGSRTAALHTPYTDAAKGGHCYLDDLQVRDHVVWCTERGIQAGFHVIGDRGMAAVTAGLRLASDKLGRASIVAARHRLEHVEMPSPEDIRLLATLGVVASVQPAFDAAWGGRGGLYERRLGRARSGPMNPFGSMHRAGVVLAFGSDSPVTPMDPWAGVKAAVCHHNRDERLSPALAFAAHTRGGHLARRDESAGVVEPGTRADYAIWDFRPGPCARRSTSPAGRLPDLAGGADLPACTRTVVGGAVAYDAEDAA